MIARRILIALLVALFVSGLFTFWLSRRFGKSHPASAQLQYVVPLKDLDAGEMLKAEDVQAIAWPSANALPGALTRPEDVVGRAVLYRLASGQPILDRQLSAVGVGVGLSAKIPDGMRAISLKSDQVVGVAGFLLPGTHIDVLVTFKNPASVEAETSTVLQDAEILAAGQKTQPDPGGKPTTVDVVTILVTPQDAEKVVLASTQGTVHFVLRNGDDHGKSDAKPPQMSALGFAPLAGAVAAPARDRKTAEPSKKPETYNVQIMRGNKQTVETF